MTSIPPASSPRISWRSSRFQRGARRSTSWIRRPASSSWTGSSTHYPANYGFIPRTYGDDGDPLDVLVLCSESMDPLTLVRVYPIGYISMLDSGKNDEKIIAIPFADPTYNTYQDIWELPGHIFDEMAHFFSVYKALEGKEAVAGDVSDRAAAIRVIQRAMDHYSDTFLGASVPRQERSSTR